MIDVPKSLEEWRYPFSLAAQMVKYRVQWGFSSLSRTKMIMAAQLREDFGEDLGALGDDLEVEWDFW